MKQKPIAAGKSSFGLIDAKLLFHTLDLNDIEILLDLACGAGNYAIELSRCMSPQSEIYAVDLWEEGILLLKEEIAARKITNIHPLISDVSNKIPIDDEKADICLMATVLHDLIQDGTDRGSIKEVRRVLKKTGRLAIIEFKKIDGPPGPPIQIRLSPEELDQYLNPHGFKMEAMVDLGPSIYLAIYHLS